MSFWHHNVTYFVWPFTLFQKIVFCFEQLESFLNDLYTVIYFFNGNSADIWAASWQNQQNGICAQRRLWPACASTQSDQSFAVRMTKASVLSYPLSAQRRLIRLGGYTGWFESLLDGRSFCWFSHEAAHIWFKAPSLLWNDQKSGPRPFKVVISGLYMRVLLWQKK